MQILITGGTGLIGKRLTQILVENGHHVHILTRKKKVFKRIGVRYFEWNIEKAYIEAQAFEGVDYIVHLAGEGIADKRWTSERKQAIIESRVKPIELIEKYLKNTPNQVKGFISASAIGFYGGDTGEQILKEQSPTGNDFLATCTSQWEAKAQELSRNLQIRNVNLRVGVVLAKTGGALPKLVQPIRLGLGAALGSGKQWLSWIHLEDICNLFVHAIETESMQGNYNAVAPLPVSNETLTQNAAKILKMPLLLPNVPSFVLNLIFGEMAVVVLGGNYVKNERISQETGFQYQFPAIEGALTDLLA